MKDSQARAFAQGFDIGAHANTHCHDWSEYSLSRAFFEDLHSFHLAYPSPPRQQGSRLHCIVWSDYASKPRIERGWGIRYDMNYYYWPGSWIAGRSGFMTGSGLPLRFADEEGQLIDVYQQETHLVDEVFATSFAPLEMLIDRALGLEGYYGAFGTHFDFHNNFGVQLTKLAVAKNVPMVSVQKMLNWTDGRNASAFENVKWKEYKLSFDVHADARTGQMLLGMLPLSSNDRHLIKIRRGEEQSSSDPRGSRELSMPCYYGFLYSGLRHALRQEGMGKITVVRCCHTSKIVGFEPPPASLRRCTAS